MQPPRSVIISCAALIAAFVIAGCGSASDDSATDNSASDSGVAAVATAQEETAPASAIDDVVIGESWYRTSSEVLGAAYLTVANNSSSPVILESVASDAATVELHETVTDTAGVMKMEPRPDGFTIEPGGVLTLEPGGKHLMLTDLTSPAPGPLGLTLHFDVGDVAASAVFDEASSAEGHDHDSMSGGDDTEASGQDEPTEDDDMSTINGDLFTYGLDVVALHDLEIELDAGTIDPARQQAVVAAARAAIDAVDWPTLLDPSELRTALDSLTSALEADDLAAAASAASDAHDAAHDLEHEAEHHAEHEG